MSDQRKSRVLASRELQGGDEGRTVTVALGFPERDPQGPDWMCPFHITGLDKTIASAGYGVDTLQALIVALERIRIELEGTGLTFSWLGIAGETGIPRLVPMAFGPEFAARISRHIDREVERIVEALQSGG